MNGWLALGIVATAWTVVVVGALWIGAAIAEQRGRE